MASATAPAGASEADALRTLQQAAQARGLAQHPMWVNLLHIKQHPITRQWRSLADDPGFFLAGDNARDAQAELNATLAAFFDPTPRHAEQQSAQCRFRSRYQWLDEQLNFAAAGLPAQPCTRYDQWRQGLPTRSVSLIFPAAYVNSPASMYGHTFLRLNADGPAAQQPLLAYAISYAAAGNEAEGLGFALKGLTGMYAGIFTNSPYYLRTRDYTHLENRDIWEYELTLTPVEIDRLLAHTWELGFTRFDYYFFDENCSYHLLSLLDVARPELALTDQFKWWAIPVDTVRSVVQAKGLLAGTHYRPSNSTELIYRAERLPPPEVAQAKALGENRLQARELPPLPADAPAAAEQRARTLELAERYATFLAARGDLSGESFRQQRLGLLTARAALPSLPDVTVPTPAVHPEQGHDTARLDFSAGQRNHRKTWRLAVRTAYHDITDPETGYSRGAQIQFGGLELAHTEGEGLRLQRFTPVDIVSLTPADDLIGGTSWKVRFGLTRAFGHAAPHAPLVLEVNGGPGRAWELNAARTAMGYVFMDNQLWHDRSLPGSTPWTAGTGVLGGLLIDPLPRWRVQLEVGKRGYLGQAPVETQALMHHRVSLDRQHNLTLRCQWQRRADATPLRDCRLGVQRYW